MEGAARMRVRTRNKPAQMASTEEVFLFGVR
jgi:hypothetical protein